MKMNDSGTTYIHFELQCFLKMDSFQQQLLRKFFLLERQFEFCNQRRLMKKTEFQWEIYKHFLLQFLKFKT